MSETLKSAPTPMQIRAELEQRVVKDLLGPAESAEEELDERSVRDRYLVGVLAPRRQAGKRDTRAGQGPSAAAHHLCFAHITDAVRDSLKSAVSSRGCESLRTTETNDE